MDEKKQIEARMSLDDLLCVQTCRKQWLCEISCEDCVESQLLAAGYRKQSEGEWEQFGLQNPKCSLCRSYNIEKSRFCPSCGAKMKGGAE